MNTNHRGAGDGSQHINPHLVSCLSLQSCSMWVNKENLMLISNQICAHPLFFFFLISQNYWEQNFPILQCQMRAGNKGGLVLNPNQKPRKKKINKIRLHSPHWLRQNLPPTLKPTQAHCSAYWPIHRASTDIFSTILQQSHECETPRLLFIHPGSANCTEEAWCIFLNNLTDWFMVRVTCTNESSLHWSLCLGEGVI